MKHERERDTRADAEWRKRVQRDTEKGLSGEGFGVFAVDDKPLESLHPTSPLPNGREPLENDSL